MVGRPYLGAYTFPVILAIALLETPSSMNWRISSSFSSRRDRRDTPSGPFGPPERLAGGPGFCEALAHAFRDQVTLDFGEQREQGSHDLGLDVLLAFDTNVLPDRDGRDTCL